NALLAAAAGWVAGLAKEQIVSGLNRAQLTGGRLHCTRSNGILVVDDTYNANPDSMQAALHTAAELSCTGRRFAVLGRMGELGTFSEEGHALVGRTAEKLRFDCVVSVGTDAARITDAISPNSSTKGLNFGSAEEAAEWLRSHTAPGDIVLFKGSRLARMEQVMNLTFPPQ
ncbi:glutamate ligase domain-containing protein, partial [Akkermansia sp.]